MVHHHLRAVIIDKFRTQIDFALTIVENDSYVSHIVRGRRKLPPEKAMSHYPTGHPPAS